MKYVEISAAGRNPFDDSIKLGFRYQDYKTLEQGTLRARVRGREGQHVHMDMKKLLRESSVAGKEKSATLTF